LILESPGVGAPERRPRHDERYYHDWFSGIGNRHCNRAFRQLVWSDWTWIRKFTDWAGRIL